MYVRLNDLGHNLSSDLLEKHLSLINNSHRINVSHLQLIPLNAVKEVVISRHEVSPSLNHHILEGDCLLVTNNGSKFH